jgi:hypothetical protein
LQREELMADWELAKEGIEPFRINPPKQGSCNENTGSGLALTHFVKMC